jgi:hypothetical protein
MSKKSQNSKSKFRATSKWKKFRKQLKDERKVDEVTLSKLYAGWNLHHCDMDEQHYTDVSNPSNFKCLNKKTHDFIHWGYNYYKKDPTFIDRIQSVWDLMKELNDKS